MLCPNLEYMESRHFGRAWYSLNRNWSSGAQSRKSGFSLAKEGALLRKYFVYTSLKQQQH